jgi:transcriptional repressor NrdR
VAAIAYPTHDEHGRPHLRLVQPRRRRSPSTYRRRRLVVALLAIALVMSLSSVLGRLGGGPLSAPEPEIVPAEPVASQSYVVQPGDTVWTIARALQPEGDLRPVVAPGRPWRAAAAGRRTPRVALTRAMPGAGEAPPRGSSVGAVRCPACSSLDDKVVDSRMADDGAAIRRRRECLACGRRYTTFERVEEVALVVVKRSGHREPFDRAKVVCGLRAATKNRPVTDERMEAVAAEVEEELRLLGPEVTSEQVGLAVLERLRVVDEVAYLRFASVYKGFEDLDDFQREVGLLTKSTEPKQPG